MCPEKCRDKRCDKAEGGCFACENDETYGIACDIPCSPGCLNGYCYKDGTCPWCNPGVWGSTCSEKCSGGCLGNTCQKDSGLCSPCIGGMWGPYCNVTCPTGCSKAGCHQSDGSCYVCKDQPTKATSAVKVPSWGVNCDRLCPSQCLRGCLRESGVCVWGAGQGTGALNVTKYVPLKERGANKTMDSSCKCESIAAFFFQLVDQLFLFCMN